MRPLQPYKAKAMRHHDTSPYFIILLHPSAYSPAANGDGTV